MIDSKPDTLTQFIKDNWKFFVFLILLVVGLKLLDSKGLIKPTQMIPETPKPLVTKSVTKSPTKDLKQEPTNIVTRKQNFVPGNRRNK